MTNHFTEEAIKKVLNQYHADQYYAGTYQGEQGFYVLLEVDQKSIEHITKKSRDIEKSLQEFAQKTDIYLTINTQNHQRKQQNSKIETPHISYIISVGAGKGGVGKSSMALQLALTFQKQKLNIGLLDADIYGPSLSLLLDLNKKPDVNENKQIIPATVNGIKCMSMGMFLEKEQPAMWRGPMIQGAITQFVKDVDWGNIDLLIIDLPPGTGDAQIGICQQLKLDGAVLVTTPQDLSWNETIKASNLFKKLDVPILGIVENMSAYTCCSCQKTTPLFTQSSDALQKDILGKIPFHPSIQEPLTSQPPLIEEIFSSITNIIWQRLEKRSPSYIQNSHAKSVAAT